MRFSRHEYWSELPFPSPGHLPNPGIEPVSPVAPALQADSLPLEPPGREFKEKVNVRLYLFATKISCKFLSCSKKKKKKKII